MCVPGLWRRLEVAEGWQACLSDGILSQLSVIILPKSDPDIAGSIFARFWRHLTPARL